MIDLRVRVTSAALVVNDKKRLRKTVRMAANEVLKQARANIRRASGGGRVYFGSGGSGAYRGGYKSGRYQASAPGEFPVSVTGTMLRALKVAMFKSGEGAAIRDKAFYSFFLEKGAQGGGKGKGTRNRRGAAGSKRVLAARPFLEPALAAKANSIEARMREAILNDIVLRPVKRGGKP